MREAAITFLIISCVLFSGSVSAQNDDGRENDASNVGIRSGLEAQTVSPGVTVVVPKGAEARRINDNLTVLESAEEYSARKFVGVEERLAKLEKENAALKKQLDHIKKYLVFAIKDSSSR